MSDKQTNIPTVEETNRKLSEPIRPEGYQARRQVVPQLTAQDENIESNEDAIEGDSVTSANTRQHNSQGGRTYPHPPFYRLEQFLNVIGPAVHSFRIAAYVHPYVPLATGRSVDILSDVANAHAVM